MEFNSNNSKLLNIPKTKAKIASRQDIRDALANFKDGFLGSETMKYAKKGKKNRRALIGVIIALAAILIALLVLVNVLENKTQDPFEEGTKISVPWDSFGSKKPKDYTWEEFEALTAEQSIAFQNYLGESGFEAWMQEAQNQITIPVPWEEDGAKQPEDYTWEEFEALTPEQSIAFQNSFDSFEDFDAWMQKALEEAENAP